mgnify:CR=1 FL=1
MLESLSFAIEQWFPFIPISTKYELTLRKYKVSKSCNLSINKLSLKLNPLIFRIKIYKMLEIIMKFQPTSSMHLPIIKISWIYNFFIMWKYAISMKLSLKCFSWITPSLLQFQVYAMLVCLIVRLMYNFKLLYLWMSCLLFAMSWKFVKKLFEIWHIFMGFLEFLVYIVV